MPRDSEFRRKKVEALHEQYRREGDKMAEKIDPDATADKLLGSAEFRSTLSQPKIPAEYVRWRHKKVELLIHAESGEPLGLHRENREGATPVQDAVTKTVHYYEPLNEVERAKYRALIAKARKE